MIRSLLLALALLFSTGPLGASPFGASVSEYTGTPEIVDGELRALLVELRFQGEADGMTDIELPDHWAGSERLYENIEDLSVENGSFAPVASPALRTIRHRPGAVLIVRYRVVGRSGADPGPGFEKAHPIIRPGWLYILGEGAFVMPAGRDDNPAAFRWAAEPEGWTFASDLDGVATSELTVSGVASSILIGGTDLRVTGREAGGQPVRVVLRGEWGFADDAFADALARVIAAENAYFNDEAIPYFVPLIPLTGGETGAISLGGTGRTGGFALASTTNQSLGDFLRLLAHEYGHRWFGGSLGPVAENGALEYWFTEGFDDFVAGQALVQSGVWTAEDYIARLNEVLLRYASSSAHGMSNTELAAAFWDNPDAQQHIYDRGHLFALVVDWSGVGEGGDVRRILRRMVREPQAFGADKTQAERFVESAAMEAFSLEEMLAGEPLELPLELFFLCGSLSWTEQPVYASGYSAETRGDGLLYFASVVEGSPAWGAGLRPNMRYIRRESFRPGDSSVPIVMRVADEVGERVLRWLPEGDETVRYLRLNYTPAPDEAEREACRARLAGETVSP